MTITTFEFADRSGLLSLGASAFKTFAVSKLENPGLLWLNERWFLEAGFDILDPVVKTEIKRKLLADFGVTTAPELGDKADVATLQADRYGGSRGTSHGGSGRCGIRGGLNAKGIGATPLASTRAKPDHTHGRLWLEEAVREIVNSEVANAELPYGAVPAVALIDPAPGLNSASGALRHKPAILVRANFVRPAHFERSTFFGTAGSVTSDQYLDAQRVREAIQAVAEEDTSPLGLGGLKTMFLRFAKQIGSGRASRLWQGSFLTSNASITGAVADLAAFRSVPNWCKTSGLPGEFGNEDAFTMAIASLTFYFRKYAPDRYIVEHFEDIRSAFDKEVNRSFLATTLSAASVEIYAANVATAEFELLIWKYYKAQQKSRFASESSTYKFRPWLYDVYDVDSQCAGGQNEEEQSLALQIRGCLARMVQAPSAPRPSIPNFSRWLRSRPRLYWDNAHGLALRMARRLTGDPENDKQILHDHIFNEVNRSRRLWPNIPLDMDIESHHVGTYYSAVYGKNRYTFERVAWLEGIILKDSFVFFGQRIKLSTLEGAIVSEDNRCARIVLLVEETVAKNGGEIFLGSCRLRLPPPAPFSTLALQPCDLVGCG